MKYFSIHFIVRTVNGKTSETAAFGYSPAFPFESLSKALASVSASLAYADEVGLPIVGVRILEVPAPVESGRTEPCCECGEEYPAEDLQVCGHIYCSKCRVAEGKR